MRINWRGWKLPPVIMKRIVLSVVLLVIFTLCSCKSVSVVSKKETSDSNSSDNSLVGEKLVESNIRPDTILLPLNGESRKIQDVGSMTGSSQGPAFQTLGTEVKEDLVETKEDSQNLVVVPLEYNKVQTMELFLSSILGKTFALALAFILGALTGLPLWNWISKKLPWSR